MRWDVEEGDVGRFLVRDIGAVVVEGDARIAAGAVEVVADPADEDLRDAEVAGEREVRHGRGQVGEIGRPPPDQRVAARTLIVSGVFSSRVSRFWAVTTISSICAPSPVSDAAARPPCPIQIAADADANSASLQNAPCRFRHDPLPFFCWGARSSTCGPQGEVGRDQLGADSFAHPASSCALRARPFRVALARESSWPPIGLCWRACEGLAVEMQQVRYFLAVARTLNFTRAPRNVPLPSPR